MFIVGFIAIVLCACYVLLMLMYISGWHKQDAFNLPANFVPKTFISVIIPARNEVLRITPCIQSLLAQNYPQHLFQIIVVDDHSSDGTAQLIKQFNSPLVNCISLADYLTIDSASFVAYKKKALQTGIEHSKGELIFTTDADCIIPSNHLMWLSAIYQCQQPVFIAAPVSYLPGNGLLYLFQLLDFISMQGISIASLQMGLGNMCNGANLAFTRKAFYAVNGYQQTEHLASGDDYFLMWKMKKAFPCKLAYLVNPQTIVQTPAAPNWHAFLQQRIRWASKSAKYNDLPLNTVLILVYLFNSSLVLLFVLALFGLQSYLLFTLLFGVKLCIELVFLWPIAQYFSKSKQLIFFPLLQPLHIVYIVLTGFLGFWGSYTWKGRSVK